MDPRAITDKEKASNDTFFDFLQTNCPKIRVLGTLHLLEDNRLNQISMAWRKNGKNTIDDILTPIAVNSSLPSTFSTSRRSSADVDAEAKKE